jgi:SAM-dependent methyltransferase
MTETLRHAADAPMCYCGHALHPDMELAISVLRCARCGYAMINEPVTREELLRLYSGLEGDRGYRYADGKRFVGFVSAMRGWFARRSVKKFIADGVPGGRSVLDFGCGQGYLLDALRQAGYRCSGAELTDESARFARQKGHAVSLDTKEFRDSSFDCVVSVHVLEHIRDLHTQVQEFSRLLVGGGSVLLEVPNFGSLQARVFQFRWFHTDIGLHIHHFSSEALIKLLASHGFTVREITYSSVEQGIMGWAQSMYNLVFPYNRFYKLMLWRQDNARRIDAWPELVLLPFVLVLSVLLYSAERILGSGPVLRVKGNIQ